MLVSVVSNLEMHLFLYCTINSNTKKIDHNFWSKSWHSGHSVDAPTAQKYRTWNMQIGLGHLAILFWGKKLLSVSSNKGFSSFTSYVQQNLQKYKRYIHYWRFLNFEVLFPFLSFSIKQKAFWVIRWKENEKIRFEF